MSSNITRIDDSAKAGGPQGVAGKANTGEKAPAILQVVELITHRYLSGADPTYLSRKHDIPCPRIDDILRFGCNRIIRAQRAELERLRMERRSAA